ncbi:conserved hypothetical protein, partial [Trichinella spiralis]|uniref:hypothetical protein n=1 Tax=Trichinella spiralis TaxID=6334 RepID=UPI0001EFDC26
FPGKFAPKSHAGEGGHPRHFRIIFKVIRNAEWAWRDRSRARMLAGSTEVNKIRHNGSLQLPQDKDNQISFVLNRDPEPKSRIERSSPERSAGVICARAVNLKSNG